MHALQARQSLAARAVVPIRSSTPRVPRRAASSSVVSVSAAYSPPSLRGATALDQLVAVSSVVPDTVLLGKTAASDAPTAATVSAAVLAGLAANPAAGVREFQVRKDPGCCSQPSILFEKQRQRRRMEKPSVLCLAPYALAFFSLSSSDTPHDMTSSTRENKKGTKRRRRRARTQGR